jgi:predicted permease
MLTDLRFAFRQMAKTPGHTAVVVLTLAFGIAVNTVIFGMINGMFLQPLAVRDPGRLVVVVERSDLFNLPHGLSFADLQDIRAGSKTLTDVIADFITPAHVSIPGRKAERGWIEAVTPDAFDKMGIGVALGRPLQASDGEMPPGVPSAVLTHSYWQSRFGGDPGVIGRQIMVNAKPLTIVGVAAPGFESFSKALSVNLFVSSGAYAALRTDGEGLFKYRSAKAWRLFAYRVPTASMADINAELAVFAQRFAKDFPQDHRHSRFHAMEELWSRPDPSMSEVMPALIALFVGLCLLVLLIACANVANLLSARALAREKELVVRAALGASRLALIRQLLVESLALAALAGLAGWLLAGFGWDVLSGSLPTGEMPIHQDSAPDWQLGLFTTAVSLLAGLLAGIAPALRSSRVDLQESLQQSTGRTAGRTRHRLRNLLVVAQVAVSCVVLVCSALFLRALHFASTTNLGFRPDHLVMLSLDLGMQGYDGERGVRFMKQALERVRALPGVESAGFTQHVPFNYAITIHEVWPDNPTGHLNDGHTAVAFTAATPGYVTMMGTPLLQGRDLAESDDAKSQKVAVINETMAKAFWPGKNPIGQHFRIDWNGAPPIEVVGVTPTGKYVMLAEEPRPYFYVPQAQRFGSPATLVVRTKGDPAGIAADLRKVTGALDPDLPVSSVVSLDEHLATSVFAFMPLRTGARIAAVEGTIALGLAIMGLYAVVSSGVTSRTREIGVRMALGATRNHVLQLISREGIRLTVIGLVAGLLMSMAMAMGLSRVIFGVRAFDAVAYPAVTILLLAIAGIACWLPARRATKVDPMVALRAE